MNVSKFLKKMFVIFFIVGLVLAGVGVLIYTMGDRMVLTVLGVQAGIWLLLGGGGLVYLAVRRSRHEELLASGVRIQAEITDVYPDASMTVNGRHPYRIACQYRDEGTKTIYTFRSEPLLFDPGAYLEGRRTVDVCVDRDRFDRYVVDVSELLDGYQMREL